MKTKLTDLINEKINEEFKYSFLLRSFMIEKVKGFDLVLEHRYDSYITENFSDWLLVIDHIMNLSKNTKVLNSDIKEFDIPSFLAPLKPGSFKITADSFLLATDLRVTYPKDISDIIMDVIDFNQFTKIFTTTLCGKVETNNWSIQDLESINFDKILLFKDDSVLLKTSKFEAYQIINEDIINVNSLNLDRRFKIDDVLRIQLN